MAGSSTWSYDALRENAEMGWTLAGDDQVLRLMKRIGQNLESRTVAVTQKIDQMLVNVDKTCIQLENVNNKLVALQKTHFFDHQIQDDEEYLKPAAPSDDVTAADKGKLSKANAEEVLKKVLRGTVNAVDKCYEKIVLDWSDSILDEDDDVIGRTMIRPIDEYKDLPRPYLIGSEDWKRSQFVGLKKEEERKKEVKEPNSNQFSEEVPVDKSQEQKQQESKTMEQQEDHAAFSDQIKADHLTPQPPPEPVDRFFKPPDLSSDFKSIAEHQKPEPVHQPSPPPSANIPTVTGFFDETPPAPLISIAARKKPNLFADLEDSDDDGGFAAAPAAVTPKALPRGFNLPVNKLAVNLFDDEPPEMEVRVPSNQVPPKVRNLFDDQVDGEIQKVANERKAVSYFDDEPKESDLFANQRKDPKVTKVKDQVNKKRIEDAVNNNNKEEDRSKERTTDENKNTVPKTTKNDMFKQSMEEMLRKGVGGGNPLKNSRPNSFDKEIIEESVTKSKERLPKEMKHQLPSIYTQPSVNSQSNASKQQADMAQEQPQTKRSKVPKGLFDDLNEEEDDLFSNKILPKHSNKSGDQRSAPVPQKVPQKQFPEVKKSVPIKKPKGLFEDEGEESDDLFGPTPNHLIGSSGDKTTSGKVPDQEPVKDLKAVASKYKSKGLFDDDTEEEDDLFKPKLNQVKKEKKPETLPSSSKTPLVPSKGMFSDEKDEDLFATKAPQPKENTVQAKVVKKPSLFDDSETDEDLFGGPKKGISQLMEIKKNEKAEEKKIEDKRNKAMEEEEIIKKAKEEESQREETEKRRKVQEEKEWKEKEIQEQKKRLEEENEKMRLAEAEKLKLERENQDRMQKLEKEKEDKRIKDNEEMLKKQQEAQEDERQKKILEEEERLEKQLEDERRLKDAKDQEEQADKKRLVEEETLRKEKAKEEEMLQKQREAEEKEEARRLEALQQEESIPSPTEDPHKKVSLFDDLDQDSEEDFLQKDLQKPPNRDSYSASVSLFDEPPEDHDYILPVASTAPKVPHFDDDHPSSEEDNLFSVKKPDPVQTPSSAVKKSINLFSDLPPEDDGEDLLPTLPVSTQKPTESVRQKKDVFYDDMADSFPPEITPKEEDPARNLLSSSMIQDRYPFEDEIQEAFAKESPVPKGIKKSETIQSVRDLIKSHENPIETTPEQSLKKSLPNKLNTSLQINVSAILPGARPPSMTKRLSMDTISFEEKDASEEEKSPNKTSASVATATPGGDDQGNTSNNSAVLSSLNKSRAKLTVKRRPSTRKGRQQSLQKSQLFDGDDIEEQRAQTSEEGSKKVEKVLDGGKAKELSFEKVEQKPKEDEKKVDPKVFQKETEKVAEKEVKKNQTEQQKTRKLFDSDDEDSDDLFKPKAKPVAKKTVLKAEPAKKEEPKKEIQKKVQRSSLFSDDNDSDEDLFGSGSTSGRVSSSTANKLPVKKDAQRTSTDHNPLADLF